MFKLIQIILDSSIILIFFSVLTSHLDMVYLYYIWLDNISLKILDVPL
jgi:hypothetical protein